MATSVNAMPTPPRSNSERGPSFFERLRSGDQVAYLLTLICAASIIVITALIVFQLYRNSALPREKFGWSFLTAEVWNPVTGEFGALPFIYGTLVTSLLALLVGVPLGVGAAIFLAELAPPRLSNALAFMIELLAAVPSVIIGMLGVFVLMPFLTQNVVPGVKAVLGWSPFFSGPFYGPSIFSASIVLTIMILPYVISISREVILAVPTDQREAALALGATKWEATFDIVLRAARTGILGSVFLSLARALGETMAVTMMVGNDPKIHTSLLAPGYSIASVVANEFAEATDKLYVGTLIEMALVLFGLTIVLNAAAQLLVLATTRKA